jgi:light-harvesting protein B-800-850 alpha chain
MNQGKIWLVVKPTVGLPLFLGGVAVIALSVHAAILTHTDWYPAYYNGNQKAKAAAAAPAAALAAPAAPAAAAPAAEAPAGKKK